MVVLEVGILVLPADVFDKVLEFNVLLAIVEVKLNIVVELINGAVVLDGPKVEDE